ncbi:MAG: GumC family protein [Anaerolineales bacterium]
MDKPVGTSPPADTPELLPESGALAAAWRYRSLVLFVIVVFATAGLLIGMSRPPEFMATASLLIEDPRASSFLDVGGGQNADRYLANQAAILRSPIIAQQAAELVAEQLESAELTAVDFLEQASIASRGGSDLIVITFVADDPQVAQASANALAVVYQQVRREEALKNATSALLRVDLSLQGLAEELPDLETRITSLRGQSEDQLALEAQLRDALTRVVELQLARSQLAPDQDEELAAINSELADLRQQLGTTQLIGQIEDRLSAENPEYVAALEEQASALDRRAELLVRRDEIEIDAELLGSGVALFSPAGVPSQSRAELIRSLTFGVVLGVLAGLGLAYVLTGRHRVFSDAYEPELALGAPLLAEIPDFRQENIEASLPVRQAPESASAEAFRFASASLEMQMARAAARSVAIVSATQGEGKSTVAVNTALAAAREGHRVLIVDADFGNQQATRLLLGEALLEVGLTEVVDEGLALDEVLELIPLKGGAELGLLSKGRSPVIAPEFLRGPEVRQFFNDIRGEFDLVIIDVPPLLQVAYGSTLVGYADAVTVVLGHGSSRSQLSELTARLDFIGTPLAGYLYNRAPTRPRTTEGSLADILGAGSTT